MTSVSYSFCKFSTEMTHCHKSFTFVTTNLGNQYFTVNQGSLNFFYVFFCFYGLCFFDPLLHQKSVHFLLLSPKVGLCFRALLNQRSVYFFFLPLRSVHSLLLHLRSVNFFLFYSRSVYFFW